MEVLYKKAAAAAIASRAAVLSGCL